MKMARKLKRLGHLRGFLACCDLRIRAVQQGVSTIAEQAAFRDVGGVQLLSHHRLDGISPKRNH